jgi:hypothetical protein
MQLVLIGFCIMWILLCGRMWWNMSRQNGFQRRLVALGTGLSAAMFYLAGMKVIQVLERSQQARATAEPSSQDVRISLSQKR